MRKNPSETKEAILRLWLDGNTYRQILRHPDLDLGPNALGTISRTLDEFRKETPNLDQLRRLNLRLKEIGLSAVDALRAFRFAEFLNSHDIGLDDMEGYIKLTEKLQSDKNHEGPVVAYAVKLMQLEKQTGKPYEKAVADLKLALSEAANVKTENNALKQENEQLKKSILELKHKNREATDSCARTLADLEEVSNANKRLRSLGLRKLVTVAKFVQDFEALGFKIERVQQLAILDGCLKRMHLDPKNLEREINQIESLGTQKTNLESYIESLQAEKQDLLKMHPALVALNNMLQMMAVYVPCKACDELMLAPLLTKEQFDDAVRRGMAAQITCLRYGSPQPWSALEVAIRIMQVLLPMGTTY